MIIICLVYRLFILTLGIQIIVWHEPIGEIGISLHSISAATNVYCHSHVTCQEWASACCKPSTSAGQYQVKYVYNDTYTLVSWYSLGIATHSNAYWLIQDACSVNAELRKLVVFLLYFSWQCGPVIKLQLLHNYCLVICGTHSSEGKGDRGKELVTAHRTWYLRPNAEFQPRKPRRPVEIPPPPSPLCTGHRCAAIQQHLRPAPRGWYCVLCDSSRFSSA